MTKSAEARRCACGVVAERGHEFCIVCGARFSTPLPEITLRRQLEPCQIAALFVLLAPVCVPLSRDLAVAAVLTCLLAAIALFIASQSRIWSSRRIVESALADARRGHAARRTLTLLEPLPTRLRSQEASGLAAVGCGLGAVGVAIGMTFLGFLLVFVSSMLRGCVPRL